MNHIIPCEKILIPYDVCIDSGNFGLPEKGTEGRNGKPIKAILFRCIPEGFNEPCPADGNLSRDARLFRESYHYVIKANGHVVKDVDEENTSWGLVPKKKFTSEDCNSTEFEIVRDDCCRILWKPAQEVVTGEYLDDFILTVGIETSSSGIFRTLSWAHNDCKCRPLLNTFLTATQQTSVARLLQYFFDKYPSIPKNGDGVAFYQSIVEDCEVSECGCTPCSDELICIANSYCEPVKNRTIDLYEDGEITYVLGFNSKGLPVKESLASFKARL